MKSREFVVSKESPATIGRSSKNFISIRDMELSRFHTQIGVMFIVIQCNKSILKHFFHRNITHTYTHINSLRQKHRLLRPRNRIRKFFVGRFGQHEWNLRASRGSTRGRCAKFTSLTQDIQICSHKACLVLCRRVLIC